jgi:hypothetical protein
MAVLKSKTKFSTPIVVAIDSFVSSALPSGPFGVTAGTRLSVDHPIVKAVPSFFADDGVDDAELLSLRTRLMMESFPAPNPPAPVAPIERRLVDEDALINIFSGIRVAKGDAEARRRPDEYVPVVPRGLSRRDALLVLTEMRQIGVGGKPERTVYAGTWIHRDDPIVRLHPHNFQALMPDVAELAEAPKSTRTEA